MRTPLVVVTGIHATAIDSAMVSLSWDLPRALVVRHHIEPGSQILTRIVSDSSGVLEREETALDHACVTCALREDILPTLRRLAQDNRWNSIVSGLPAATDAEHLASALVQDTRLARHLRLSSVVNAVATDRLVDDLLGDDLLPELGLHTHPDDRRGVGEVACAQIEFSDVIMLTDNPGLEATDLVRALAKPDALLIAGADQLDGATLATQLHQHKRTTAWRSPMLDVELPALVDSHAWRLDLSSSRPFHPERLLAQIERLGTGRHRSRGCFWVPTRPGMAQEWAGAGGQLSIGHLCTWGRRTPVTRLVHTGIGTAPTDLIEAFDDILLTPGEARLDQTKWNVHEDGLEPWLGDIRDVA